MPPPSVNNSCLLPQNRLYSTLQVYLDTKEQVNMETKLDTFSFVSKKLMNREVVFEFPIQD